MKHILNETMQLDHENDTQRRRRITLTLEDIEEYEAQAMLKALDMSSAIDWFANRLRNLDKHGDFETQEARNLAERLRHEFYTEVVSEVPED